MNKSIIFLAALTGFGLLPLQAQVRTANVANNIAVTNSPAFIDASSNTTINSSPNVGKGLIFPRLDLSAMSSFPGVTAGIPNSFPTRFDGMIVYNTATSGTAGVGSTSGTLSPGFWFYENKSATNNGGTWKPMGTLAAAAVEPWYNVATNTGATANTQDIYQMGKVGIGTAAPNSTLHTNGSFATRYIAVAANTTLDATHHTVNAVHNSGTVTLTLPPVTGVTGRQYVVQNNGTGTTNVVVSGGGTIEGLSTFTLNQIGQTAQLIAGNSEWQLVTNAIKSASVPSGANIYTADGTLSGNRIVNQGGNNLNFEGTGKHTINNTFESNGSTYLNSATQSHEIFPASNNAYALGASTARYSAVWSSLADIASDATIGGNAIVGTTLSVNGNTYLNNATQSHQIYPASNNTYALGASTARYSAVWSSLADIASDATIGGNAIIGTTLSVNGNTYLNNATQTHELYPASNNTYALGTSTARYSSIWSSLADIASDATIGGNAIVGTTLSVNGSTYLNNATQSHQIYPASNNTYALGASTARFSTLWSSLADISSDATIGGNAVVGTTLSVNGNTYLNSSTQTHEIFPAANNTYALGAATARYTTVWTNNIDIGANLTAVGTATYNGTSVHNGSTYLNNSTQTHELFPAADGTFAIGSSTGRYSAIYAVNGLIQTSDERLKKNIKVTNYGLNSIMRIRPVEYNWKDGKGKHMIGFIAQDMEKVIPEVVDIPTNSSEYYGMNYNQLIPVLTKAIQEQQAQIEHLKTENKELKSDMEAIKKKLGL